MVTKAAIVSQRAATSIFKEVEEVYDRITRRAYAIYKKRGVGDQILDVEDWISAEREMIFRPKAKVTISERRFHLELDITEIDLDRIEVVVTRHNILFWSPKDLAGRTVFRIVSVDGALSSQTLEADLEAGRLLLMGLVVEC